MGDDQAIAEGTAIILTGGKSSRMGRPKALLIFDGEPLITHLVCRLKSLFTDTVVVAAPEQELPPLQATLVRDEVAYQGPVGGIYYGLRAAKGEVCFVTSCDVPFLNLSLITHLTSQIANYDVVVPYWQGRFQPLHALYRRSVAPLLKDRLRRAVLHDDAFIEENYALGTALGEPHVMGDDHHRHGPWSACPPTGSCGVVRLA